MAIIKGFTFDDINSLDYDIAITEEGTYSAPQRDIEIVNIPGRNGSYIIDNGRYANTQVTYHCVIGNDDQERFNEKFKAFRNKLLSKVGYKKLFDDFHPDEYRLGSCVNGIDFVNTPRIAGEFNVVFDCKPQRYLVSGETPVDVENGDTIVNPTLFPSSPIIEIEGYGDISINDSEMSIADSPLGWIDLANAVSKTYGKNDYVETFRPRLIAKFINSAVYYTGDMARASAIIERKDLVVASSSQKITSITNVTVTSKTDYIVQFSVDSRKDADTGDMLLTFIAVIESVPFATVDGQNSGYVNLNAQVEIEYTYGTPSQTGTTTVNWSSVFDYSATDVAFQAPSVTYVSSSVDAERQSTAISIERVKVASTYSSLGNPLYFDLETGEAYKYENGEIISVNNAVWLGTALPELAPGVNTITYGEDIHDLKIVPRWWIL